MSARAAEGRSRRAALVLGEPLDGTASRRARARKVRVEARLRALFRASRHALLVVDPQSFLVVDVNPSARRALDAARLRVHGTPVSAWLGDELTRALREATHNVVERHDRTTHGDRHLVGITASRLPFPQRAFWVVRIADGEPLTPEGSEASRRALDRLPEGLVVTDPQGRVGYANDAFVALAELSDASELVGQAVDTWLGRGRVELAAWVERLRAGETIRQEPSVVRGERGARTAVDVSAVGVDDALGFLVASHALPDVDPAPLLGATLTTPLDPARAAHYVEIAAATEAERSHGSPRDRRAALVERARASLASVLAHAPDDDGAAS